MDQSVWERDRERERDKDREREREARARSTSRQGKEIDGEGVEEGSSIERGWGVARLAEATCTTTS